MGMTMPMRSPLLLGLALCLAGPFLTVAGCTSTPAEHAEEPTPTLTAGGDATWTGIDVATLPGRFGHGRDATSAEIAALDIDVSPDGTGLPPGQGTVADGATVYAAQCAACHGPRGEGTPVGDRLVGNDPLTATGWGRTIGNYWPYAPTVFDYIRRAMPFDQPGSLTDEEVYAVTAFLLHLNEIIPEDAVMNARTLPLVEMPARDRFVPDDRETNTRIR
jgi:S-disulfanyl-L-cysteine oxidoreductase SoxD